MRKFIIAAALAASALIAAAPAAAQWYPPQPGYGYGYGYNNYGQVRRLQARVDNAQRQIDHFDRRNILSNKEAKRLRSESRDIERRLRHAAGDGLRPDEAYSIDRRIQRLEYRIQSEARDGNRYGYYRTGYDYGWGDRDRDGRDDRYENDRGWEHDD